ncbi:hypothetical protein B0H13DRAFT_1881493 [Mycena leptocephala]|nr:hypothetical protein B0H13DRAFT_1881493 [Mycena leptocephala]
MAGVSNSVAPRENWGEDLDARHRWFTSTPQRVRISAERMGSDLEPIELRQQMKSRRQCPAQCAFQRIALDLLEYGHLGNDVEASHAAMKLSYHGLHSLSRAHRAKTSRRQVGRPGEYFILGIQCAGLDNEGAPFERRVAPGYKPEKRITGILGAGMTARKRSVDAMHFNLHSCSHTRYSEGLCSRTATKKEALITVHRTHETQRLGDKARRRDEKGEGNDEIKRDAHKH